MEANLSNCNLVPLDELTEEDTPITYGVVKPGDEGDVLFIRGGDIAGGRILNGQLRTISREVSLQYRRTLLRGGEILVSLVGNPGQVTIVPQCLAGANIARQVGLVRLKPRVDTHFVKYFLQSPLGQTALGAQSLGSVQQVINLRDLKTVKIPLLPIAEQRAIAHVLGTLDDKIELNRRMNETLEAMARIIFKSWFVDFDPVRAKMDGRQPTGMDPATAALLPDSFEDSSLGKIPKGWPSRLLGDLIELKRGHDLPERERRAGHVPIYSSSGLTGWHDTFKAKGPGVVTGRYGTIGKVFYVEEDFWPLNTTLYVCDFKTSNPRFISHLLQTIDFQSFVDKAAVPGINRNHVHQAAVVAPPIEIQYRFGKMLEPTCERQRSNGAEITTLTAIRDALLPKLLSGEIRVTDTTCKEAEALA